jgi:gliding motility-associated-like protein
MKKGFSLIWFAFILYSARSQSICFQFPTIPVNIINNPSFEIDPAGCTSGYFGQLGLNIPYWSTPTNEILTGYLNACTNFLVPDSIILSESFNNVYMYMFPLVPQPIPDGYGVAAVADFGYEGNTHSYPFEKSYVSTCLSGLLKKDSLYRLDFYVGFGTMGNEIIPVHTAVLPPEASRSEETFTLFGLTACSTISLPLIGCAEVAGWIPLGSCTLKHTPGSWVKTDISFRSPADILSIALGPSCDTILDLNPGIILNNGDTLTTNKYSYFLDALQLNQATVPLPTLQIESGNSCSESVILQVEPSIYHDGFNFSWYRNGVLLASEHNNVLSVSRQNYGTGYYQCSVERDSICLGSDSLFVQLIQIPSTTILGKSDTLACIGDTVLLNAFTDSSSTYTWQDGSTLPYFSTAKSGIYSVIIANVCGTASAQKTINFEKCSLDLFVPNAFTPNGDGKNDLFNVGYYSLPLKFTLGIYNRNGQKIFSSTDISTGWNGNYNGNAQAAGTYVYEIEFTDRKGINHSLKGTIELIR